MKKNLLRCLFVAIDQAKFIFVKQMNSEQFVQTLMGSGEQSRDQIILLSLNAKATLQNYCNTSRFSESDYFSITEIVLV